MTDGSKTDHNTDEFMWISKVANNQYKVWVRQTKQFDQLIFDQDENSSQYSNRVLSWTLADQRKREQSGADVKCSSKPNDLLSLFFTSGTQTLPLNPPFMV